MTTNTGYVLVSQVFKTTLNSCPKCTHSEHICETPFYASCSPARDLLATTNPEQRRRAWEDWRTAHETEEPTGGTRLSPLHYFSDCQTLLKRGPRRKDARIVEMAPDVAQSLGLPLCKECKARMAPFERQFVEMLGPLVEREG